MTPARTISTALVLAALAGAPGSALAQRAGDNAVTAAQDAFGTTVGNESIGLYGTQDVRGFDPVQAGNARLEGLYFDRQADPTNRLISGSSVHVGISAQSYPFPAPTGIADFNLRLPGEKYLTSAVASYGPYNAFGLEIDTQVPLVPGKLSFGGGISGTHEEWAWGADAAVWSAGGIFRWRPNDNVEIVPFGAMVRRRDFEGQISILAGGAFLPPPIKRGPYYGQDWADYDTEQTTYGMIARVALPDDWNLRAGVFRSFNLRLHQGENLFLNTQADGSTSRFAVLSPENSLGSTSGEIRVSRSLTEAQRKHTLNLSFRARDKDRIFGGSKTIALGPGFIGVPDPEPLPAFSYGPRSSNHSTQATGGFSYEILWANVGEASFGVQKTFYRRRSLQPGVATIRSKDNPWLFNGTLAVHITDSLAAYGGYTRGLEESAEAPSSSRNRGEAVPASRTAQLDAGLRYTLAPGVRLVAGVFEVKKPYFNLDATNLFTRVGNLRHRGIEISLAGQPLDGLTVVAGTVLLQARVSGEPVDLGRIGRIPLGKSPRVSRLNLQYAPGSWSGFSVEGQLENVSSRYANFLNTVRTPGRTLVNLGARYRFKIVDAPATLRFQAQNVGDVFRWNVNATGSFEPVERRRFTVSLTTDF